MNDYIYFNSRYLKKERFTLPIDNRAFLYGDGFFETIHANGTEPQFFPDHLIRIKYALEQLQLHLPESYSINKLNNAITGLLVRNKLFVGARVRLTFFRQGEGKYTPQSDNCALLITTEPLANAQYSLNKQGLEVGIYDKMPKPIWPLGQIKSLNASIYTCAGIYGRQHAWDDTLLVNPHGHIIEATSSNIFVYHNKQVVTPALNSGCVAGIMRKQLFHVIESMNFTLDTSTPVTSQLIKEAEEIWLSNSISGIRWVKKCQTGRYYNLKAREVTKELNYMAFEYA